MTGPVLRIPLNILQLLVDAKNIERDVRVLLQDRAPRELPSDENDLFWALVSRHNRMLDEVAFKLRAVNRGYLKTLERHINRTRRNAKSHANDLVAQH